MALHISISAEPLFYIGSVPITNSILTSWIVTALLIFIALKFHRSRQSLSKPTGLQNLLEMIVETFYNLGNSITQSDLKTAAIMPIPFAAFLWILANNWFGLLPGVGTWGINSTEAEESNQEAAFPKAVFASEPTETETYSYPETESAEPAEDAAGSVAESSAHTVKFVPILRPGTADLNTTLALALISVGATQVIGVKFLGKAYWSKFFNLKGIFSFVGILELISEISKIISFAFRLFGNIFAGEVLLAVMMFLVPLLVPVPFIFLELFVGVIQALVFAMLTIVFMNIATIHGGDEH